MKIGTLVNHTHVKYSDGSLLVGVVLPANLIRFPDDVRNNCIYWMKGDDYYCYGLCEEPDTFVKDLKKKYPVFVSPLVPTQSKE